jgi:hypothetical protein
MLEVHVHAVTTKDMPMLPRIWFSVAVQDGES